MTFPSEGGASDLPESSPLKGSICFQISTLGTKFPSHYMDLWGANRTPTAPVLHSYKMGDVTLLSAFHKVASPRGGNTWVPIVNIVSEECSQ